MIFFRHQIKKIDGTLHILRFINIFSLSIIYLSLFSPIRIDLKDCNFSIRSLKATAAQDTTENTKEKKKSNVKNKKVKLVKKTGDTVTKKKVKSVKKEEAVGEVKKKKRKKIDKGIMARRKLDRYSFVYLCTGIYIKNISKNS